MRKDPSALAELIMQVPWRRRALEAVAALDLADCWVGAGFVRAPLWDTLHQFERPTPIPDIDVIYFQSENAEFEVDLELEHRLVQTGPTLPWPHTYWSVRNQARMHTRNGDTPYRDTADAMAHWLETPTAVAIRLNADGAVEILSPFGLADLFEMVIRPTPHARALRMAAFHERIASKDWLDNWPQLRIDVS